MEDLQGGTLALEHHYHLDKRVGSFGLVTVYEGTQDPFDQPVRVTVYDGLLDAGAAPSVTARIKKSARRASFLEPSGLLAVVDFGEIEQGVPFVIEETLRGTSLARCMSAQSVFSPDDVLTLVDRLADLLATAHDAGICHGNLKPEWILLPGEDGPLDQARISHFALSPSMHELVEMPQAVLTTDLVETFPPECFDVAARDQSNQPDEQTTPPHLTAEADQWALAALSYRLLVGMHPYFDDPVDASEGILRIKTEAPPSLGEMGVDEQIAAVVDRALSSDPADRWPSIKAFSTNLREAIAGPATTPSADAPPSPEPPPASAAPAEEFADHDEKPATPELMGPRPSGYLLTAAVAAFVLSNLGWFFMTMDRQASDAEEPAAVAEPPSDPSILPTGVQLETTPDDAELFVVRDDDEVESLGPTPHLVTESLIEDSEGHLLLRHPSYFDQPLYISETESGPNIRLSLIADDTEESDDGS